MFGHIHLILGCMFSGKTSELIRMIKRYKSIGKKVLFINFAEDTRYGNDQVYTHDQTGYEGDFLTNLNQITLEQKQYFDVFVINEGQFFEHVKEFALELCEQYGKDVVISGLDGDFQRKTFSNNLLELIPISDSVQVLTAFCVECGDETPARFSKRLTNDLNQKLIGVSQYHPVCRKHYLQ